MRAFHGRAASTDSELALKPAATLDCTAPTATLPASKCADGKVITGFDSLGAPICTAITTVYSAADPTTLYLEPAGCYSHLTTNTTCWALMCSPANGVFSLRNCTNGNCISNINNTFVNCDTTKVGVLLVGP